MSLADVLPVQKGAALPPWAGSQQASGPPHVQGGAVWVGLSQERVVTEVAELHSVDWQGRGRQTRRPQCCVNAVRPLLVPRCLLPRFVLSTARREGPFPPATRNTTFPSLCSSCDSCSIKWLWQQRRHKQPSYVVTGTQAASQKVK